MTNPLDTAAVAEAERISPRLDLGIAAAFAAFGIAGLTLALRMPTYLDQKGEIYVAPGFVPTFYCVVILLLSAILGLRSLRRLRDGLRANVAEAAHGSGLPLAIVAALGLLFCFVLIGRLPFWLASALFVTAFIVIFELPMAQSSGERWRRLATAAVQGVATGWAVTLVFEKLFLVRLP